jgi:hypothetical protein
VLRASCFVLLAVDSSIPSVSAGHPHRVISTTAGALLSSCIFTADCPIRALALHDLRVHDTVRCLKGEPTKMMPRFFHLTIMPALCAPRNSNLSRSSKGCCQSGGLHPSPSSHSSYSLATWRRQRQPGPNPPLVLPPGQTIPLRFQTTLLIHSACSLYSRWLSSTHCQQQQMQLNNECNCRLSFIHL